MSRNLKQGNVLKILKMKKFHRTMSDLSDPTPFDFDPESMMASSEGTDASDNESLDDLAVEHYLSVG
jgi:hypothetical protein